MEDEAELLQTIRRKEMELAKIIDAAREAAAARVAEAEREAARIREAAEREAIEEADTLKREGMAALKAEEERIIREGEVERARLRAGSESRIPVAADRICQVVTLR